MEKHTSTQETVRGQNVFEWYEALISAALVLVLVFSLFFRIIQVDEPALRELLPLRRDEQPQYLDWSVNSFRLATSGVKDSTQIHTHLCYSEFNEIIDSINALNADVTSIEAARSHMELLADIPESFVSGLGCNWLRHHCRPVGEPGLRSEDS